MAGGEQFETGFRQLRPLLEPYAPALAVTADGPGDYALSAPAGVARPRELFFGAARIGRRYISYHLMPVSVFPTLLADISPGPRRRRPDKPCLNFTRLDEATTTELAAPTRRGFDACRTASLL